MPSDTTPKEAAMHTREDQMHELHDHYARNAQARGHTADCALVTTLRNWPTICGRPACSCSRGRHWCPAW